MALFHLHHSKLKAKPHKCGCLFCICWGLSPVSKPSPKCTGLTDLRVDDRIERLDSHVHLEDQSSSNRYHFEFFVKAGSIWVQVKWGKLFVASFVGCTAGSVLLLRPLLLLISQMEAVEATCSASRWGSPLSSSSGSSAKPSGCRTGAAHGNAVDQTADPNGCDLLSGKGTSYLS